MIFTAYAVKDEMTERFMEPQYFLSEKEAIRNFKHQINNIKLWKENATDFSLYKMGEFSEEEGFLKDTLCLTKVTGGRALLEEN